MRNLRSRAIALSFPISILLPGCATRPPHPVAATAIAITVRRLLIACVAIASITAALPLAAQNPRPVTQTDEGNLHGDFLRITKPIREIDVGAASFRNMHLSPDAKKLAVHEWDRDDKGKNIARDVIRDAVTGKLDRVLLEIPGIPARPPSLAEFLDAKSYINYDKDDGFSAYSVETGAVVRNYPQPDKRTELIRFWISGDGGTLASETREGGAVVWDLGRGDSRFVDLGLDLAKQGTRVVPLAGGKKLLVGVAYQRGPARTEIRLVDVANGKANRLLNYNELFEFLPTSDGKELLILRRENPDFQGWTGIEFWDLAKSQLVRKQPMVPPLSAISAKVSHDGRFLFIHEYMVQPVVIWDLQQGRIVATVAPAGGGCEAFDVTADGKTLVAKVGLWEQGALHSRTLAAYDISSVTQPEKVPAHP